jgi:uncharacterized coiled-coil DUF342 family protein
LNEAVRKLFELRPDSVETVCANVDFFRKIKIVRSALTAQISRANIKKQIRKIFNRIARINDYCAELFAEMEAIRQELHGLARACLQLSKMIAEARWTPARKFLASLS